MNLSLHSALLPGAFIDNAATYSNNGIGRVQLHPRSLGLADPDALVPPSLLGYVKDTGTHAEVQFDSLAFELNPVYADAATFETRLGQLSRAIELAEGLGARFINLDGPRQLPQAPTKEALTDRLQRLMAAAGDTRLAFAFQPVRQGELSGSVQTRRLLDRVKDERLRVILDPAALREDPTMGDFDREISKEIDWLSGSLAGVYVREDTAAPINWRFPRLRLDAVGYTGPFIIRDVQTDLKGAIGQLAGSRRMV